MIALSTYPTLENVKKEVEGEINGYIHAITLLSSLREHLKNKNIECHIEPKITEKAGGFKTPDLLIKSNGFLIIDHKYTESTDERNLLSKIDEMEKYSQVFIFLDKSTGTQLNQNLRL